MEMKPGIGQKETGSSTIQNTFFCLVDFFLLIEISLQNFQCIKQNDTKEYQESYTRGHHITNANNALL